MATFRALYSHWIVKIIALLYDNKGTRRAQAKSAKAAKYKFLLLSLLLWNGKKYSVKNSWIGIVIRISTNIEWLVASETSIPHLKNYCRQLLDCKRNILNFSYPTMVKFFQNLTATYLSKDTSPAKFSKKIRSLVFIWRQTDRQTDERKRWR